MTVTPELYTQEFFADPHPTYAEIREAAPVRRVRNPNGLEYWLVSRYDDAKAIFADGRLAKDPRHAWEALRAAGMVRGEPGDATFDLHTTDPPDHARLRNLVGVAFTPGRVAALRPRIEAIADELRQPIATRGSGDLIEDYAYPLSLTVIAELLGVPVADRDQFREWTMKAMTPPFAPGGQEVRAEGGRLLRQYVTELVAAKRDNPAEDLLSALIVASADEDRLTEAELVAITQQLLFAGHEPATNLIGNGMISLFANPDQLALLRERPELLPKAVEELLRYDGPTARSSPSYPLADIEVGGTVIPARAEGEIAIGALLRLPQLRPARPLEELEWLPFPVFRGVAALPVTCG